MKLNRIHSRSTQSRNGCWCRRCDMKVVAEGQRCPVCHFRNPERKLKGFQLEKGWNIPQGKED